MSTWVAQSTSYKDNLAQLTWAVEYTKCISAEK